MFKEIFNRVMALIIQPRRAWVDLKKMEEGKDDFLAHFVYPLIGLVTLAAFLGILFTRKEFDLELALKSSIRALVAAFGGFFIGAYLLNELVLTRFKLEKNMRNSQRFVGYASSLMFTINIIFMIFPQFFLLRIFVFYTFYMIWESIGVYWQVEENSRLKFVGIVTLIILGSPVVVEKLITFLMPGLRV